MHVARKMGMLRAALAVLSLVMNEAAAAQLPTNSFPDRSLCRINDYLLEVDTRASVGTTADGQPIVEPVPMSPFKAQLNAAFGASIAGSDNQAGFLALSGGGPDGAYGASFMRQWELTGTMPEFKVVSGISTGALQSPFAFLGDRDSLQQMEDLYANITNDGVFEERDIIIAAAFHSGLNRLRPLRALLVELIEQNDWLNRIAAEHARGRRLFVGVVELNSGKLFAIDITAIAADTGRSVERRTTCFADSLVASSAVPGFFDPVIMRAGRRQRFIFVDGGVRAGSFVEDLALTLAETYGATGRNTVIINGALDQCPEVVRPGIINVADRSLSVLINQNVNSSLSRIVAQTQNTPGAVQFTAVGRTFARERMGVDLCDFPSGTTSFNPDFLNLLIEHARMRWQIGRACAFGQGDACS